MTAQPERVEWGSRVQRRRSTQDPSLRLKTGFARDDASKYKSKLSYYRIFDDASHFAREFTALTTLGCGVSLVFVDRRSTLTILVPLLQTKIAEADAGLLSRFRNHPAERNPTCGSSTECFIH